jgi:hypothetical protein
VACWSRVTLGDCHKFSIRPQQGRSVAAALGWRILRLCLYAVCGERRIRNQRGLVGARLKIGGLLREACSELRVFHEAGELQKGGRLAHQVLSSNHFPYSRTAVKI